MTDAVQVLAIAVSAALLLFVLDLVRRRKLTEEYSFIWIVFALVLLGLSIWRESLHAVARWLDIHYPPALLLAGLIFFVFVASLYFSVVISRQRDQIERLVETIAILEAKFSLVTLETPSHHLGSPASASPASATDSGIALPSSIGANAAVDE